MKKVMFFMMAFAAVGMVMMVSCGKENTQPEENAQADGNTPTAPADTTGGETPHEY